MRDSIVEGALEFVNEVRQKHGAQPLQDLLKGERGSSCYCPIARSLMFENGQLDWVSVSPGLMLLKDRDTEEAYRVWSPDIPQAARTFMLTFDQGCYEEYRS